MTGGSNESFHPICVDLDCRGTRIHFPAAGALARKAAPRARRSVRPGPRLAPAFDAGLAHAHGQLLVVRTPVDRPQRRQFVRVQRNSRTANRRLGVPAHFPVDAHGLGLSGMAERARLVGGKLVVASEPGRGTALTLQVP